VQKSKKKNQQMSKEKQNQTDQFVLAAYEKSCMHEMLTARNE